MRYFCAVLMLKVVIAMASSSDYFKKLLEHQHLEKDSLFKEFNQKRVTNIHSIQLHRRKNYLNAKILRV